MNETFFRDRKLNRERLQAFGFAEREGGLVYCTALADSGFELTVTVSDGDRVSARVVDPASGEEYVLHRVPGAAGAFVGRVREQYQAVLERIAEKCCDSEVFRGEIVAKVIAYVRETYGCELEFLWEKFPTDAIWRRKDNQKWFGALLTVAGNKLGASGDEIVEIIDLRIEPERIDALVDGTKYFPGYHMNKRHWFTVCLDGSVPAEEIFRRIDSSFALAAKK